MARYGVTIPEIWNPRDPLRALAPLPLEVGVVRGLYEDVGLPVFHMSLLLGVDMAAVRSGLRPPG